MITFIYDAGIYGLAIVAATDIEHAKAILLEKYPLFFVDATWFEGKELRELDEGGAMFVNGRANLFAYYDYAVEREFGHYHIEHPYVKEDE